MTGAPARDRACIVAANDAASTGTHWVHRTTTVAPKLATARRDEGNVDIGAGFGWCGLSRAASTSNLDEGSQRDTNVQPAIAAPTAWRLPRSRQSATAPGDRSEPARNAASTARLKPARLACAVTNTTGQEGSETAAAMGSIKSWSKSRISARAVDHENCYAPRWTA